MKTASPNMGNYKNDQNIFQLLQQKVDSISPLTESGLALGLALTKRAK